MTEWRLIQVAQEAVLRELVLLQETIPPEEVELLAEPVQERESTMVLADRVRIIVDLMDLMVRSQDMVVAPQDLQDRDIQMEMLTVVEDLVTPAEAHLQDQEDHGLPEVVQEAADHQATLPVQDQILLGQVVATAEALQVAGLQGIQDQVEALQDQVVIAAVGHPQAADLPVAGLPEVAAEVHRQAAVRPVEEVTNRQF